MTTQTKEKYQMVNGTSYNFETSQDVINILEKYRLNQEKIRVFYGDTETGKNWHEEYDTMGRISRSMGNVKIPLLIKNKRSLGGGGILDNRIIRIDAKDSTDKIVTVYQHPKFVNPEFEIVFNEKRPDQWKWEANQTNEPDVNSQGMAAFKTKEQAERWAKFMRGERWAK